MTTTYYKVLAEDGSAFHGGSGKWHLPSGKRPGKWMPKIESLEACKRGYHVCEHQDVIHWIGPAIFEVEIRGESIRHEGKTVAQEARLVRRLPWDKWSAILWAADCAERALQREKDAGRWDDERSWNAVYVARQVGRKELDQAARSGAKSARSAAKSAESAAKSAESAAWSAWAAAESAWAATQSAWAESAPRSAESAAQSAESAAWSAARSAWAPRSALAATEAAWSAARSAESAAWYGERGWQTNRLFDYLEGRI